MLYIAPISFRVYTLCILLQLTIQLTCMIHKSIYRQFLYTLKIKTEQYPQKSLFDFLTVFIHNKKYVLWNMGICPIAPKYDT